MEDDVYLGYDDDDEPNQVYNFSAELETEADKTYYMMIDSWNGVEGEFCLEVTKLDEPTTILSKKKSRFF